MTLAATDWKKAARKQWNTNPCGEAAGDKETLNYFLTVERHRYDEYAPWMKTYLDFQKYSGKDVLELGFGQGTDLCQFALAGARCSGVDITEGHMALARRNLELRGLRADLFLEDASKLHFPDESFDVVYSFGVLHHTPDTIRCIGEAYRVLKPGGELILGLYHKWSAAYLVRILFLKGILRGKLWKLGHAGLLSTVERGADGIHVKPLVKVYSVSDLRLMLSDFSTVAIDIKHLPRPRSGVLRVLALPLLLSLLEGKLGWFVIARAVK